MTTLTPLDLRHVADTTARILQNEYGHKLDYSLISLKHIDTIIQDLLTPGSSPDENLPSTLFGLGAYVGETLIRRVGGRWIQRIGWYWVSLRNGFVTNPIGKVRARFRNCSQDSLAAFGLVMSGLDGGHTLAGPASEPADMEL